MFIGGAVVGVFWVLWHLPLLTSTTLPFESTNPMVFGFQTVGIAVLLAWLYQRKRTESCSGDAISWLAELYRGVLPHRHARPQHRCCHHLGCRTRCGSRRA